MPPTLNLTCPGKKKKGNVPNRLLYKQNCEFYFLPLQLITF